MVSVKRLRAGERTLVLMTLTQKRRQVQGGDMTPKVTYCLYWYLASGSAEGHPVNNQDPAWGGSDAKEGRVLPVPLTPRSC